MTRAETLSLAIYAGILALFLVDKAEAVPTDGADKLTHYESRMAELSAIVFPPPIEGSYQRIDTKNGRIHNSNVRDPSGLHCRYQSALDGTTPVIFEFCEGEK